MFLEHPAATRLSRDFARSRAVEGGSLGEGVMNRLRPLIERGDMKLVYELFTPNWNSQLAASSVVQVLDTH